MIIPSLVLWPGRGGGFESSNAATGTSSVSISLASATFHGERDVAMSKPPSFIHLERSGLGDH